MTNQFSPHLSTRFSIRFSIQTETQTEMQAAMQAETQNQMRGQRWFQWRCRAWGHRWNRGFRSLRRAVGSSAGTLEALVAAGGLASGGVVVAAETERPPAPAGAVEAGAPPTSPSRADFELDETTRIALDATPDGRDLRDEAWHRLVAETVGWPRTAAAFERATVVRPQWREVLADPDRFRGLLLEASGRLEQSSPVRTPGIAEGAVVEWFVRTRAGGETASGASPTGPVIQVFVPADHAGTGEVGRAVSVVGRFLRRTELEGRDGTTRTFPTIVGVPIAAGPAASAWSPGAVIALATLILVPVALLVRRSARRHGRSRPRIEPHERDESPPARHDLPSDPAAALGVLAEEAGDRIR